MQASDLQKYPLAAVTQRPMAMYHSWDSQNAWLRQIHTHNYLFVNPKTARAAATERRMSSFAPAQSSPIPRWAVSIASATAKPYDQRCRR